MCPGKQIPGPSWFQRMTHSKYKHKEKELLKYAIGVNNYKHIGVNT